MRIKATLEYNEDFHLTASFLGIKIPILPKKPKKYNIKNYTPKKIAKRKKKAEEAELKKQENAKKKAEKKKQKKKEEEERLAKMTPEEIAQEKADKKASRPSILAIIRLAKRLLGILIPRFFKHIHIEVARIRVKIATGDAATTAVMYGAAYQGVELIIAMLKKIVHVHDLKNADIHLEPDFLGDKIEADIKITVSLRLGSIIGLLLKVAFKAAVGFIKIMPKGKSNGKKKKSKAKNKPQENKQLATEK